MVGFCVIESSNLVDSLIKECGLWRDALFRVVIEKARPRLLDLYKEMDEEMVTLTLDCNKDISILKTVLGAIVRI